MKQPSSQKKSGGKGPASYFPQQTLGHVFHSSRLDSRSDVPTTIEARINSPTGAPGGIIGQFQGQGAQRSTQGQAVSQGQGQSQDRNTNAVISNTEPKAYPQTVPKTHLSQSKSNQSQNVKSMDVVDLSHDLQTLSLESRSHDSIQSVGAVPSVISSNSDSSNSLGVQGTSDPRTSVAYGYQSADPSSGYQSENSSGSQQSVTGHQLGYQQHDRRPNSAYGVGQEGE